jgi:hypothetical protein
MQSAFPGPDQPGQPPGPLKTSGTATLALVTGVLSFVCLFGLGGLLAIALGWVAHGEIERSQGRVTGKGLASVGIGLGITNLVASVVGVGVLVALALRPDPPSAVAGPALPPVAAPAPLAPPGRPRLPAPSSSPEVEVTPEALTLPALPPQIGKIAVIEALESGEALEPQLLKQLAESAKSGERLMLWTVTTGCEPCAAVGRALPDARMQRALSGVRLVRTDVRAFAQELERLGVPIESVPGFTLLDRKAHPLDHIHGGEWGDDIPANIAPILDKFVRRSLATRRYQWARPLRDGETPL